MNFKIGDRIFVRGYIDEIRKDTVIVRNDGGYFGTILSEVTPSAQPEQEVEPERKTGKWNGYNADNPDWLRDDGSPVFLTCSECHGAVMNNGSAHWNFCPNCGADMRGDTYE